MLFGILIKSLFGPFINLFFFFFNEDLTYILLFVGGTWSSQCCLADYNMLLKMSTIIARKVNLAHYIGNLPYSRACVQTIWGKLSLLEHVLFSDTDSRQIPFSKIRNAMLYFKINSSLLQYIWIFNNYETQNNSWNRNRWKSNQPKWLLIWPRLIQLMTL